MPQIITSLLQHLHLLRNNLCLVPLGIEMYLVAGYTSFHSGGDGCQVLHSGHIGLGESDDLAVVIYEFSWRLAVFAFHLFAELGRTLDQAILPTGAVKYDMCVEVRLPFLCGTVVMTFVEVDMELNRSYAEFLTAEFPELLSLLHCGIFPDYQHCLLQRRSGGLHPLPCDFGICCLDSGEGFGNVFVDDGFIEVRHLRYDV